MHRTTTTALLMMMAASTVSAVSGCVTVNHPSTPRLQPATAPSPVSSPLSGTDGKAEPQIVQAPAREALELIEPSRRASPSPGPRTSAPASPESAPRRSHPAQSERPEAPRMLPRPGHPLPLPDRHSGKDVCDLGREYGRWQPNSLEDAVCRDMYGR
ncbi:hypothetical protein H1V43_33960 [Streptomyces sp. PSKA54]|uniref:Lipoprotein n=1 Tax=Streptomyces himalayensis subsp. aureolus TaxID=2758039 RepID=A0A7W2D7K4_9ACTN|nr:hypothetical protein [Streptomyces himalayensis]MBA4866240.1 hypothetical protein [Streptomyces himalayensis subsp. aureolus]